MEKKSKGLWDYREKWEKIPDKNKAPIWEKSWIDNSLCKDCKFCCGPQDSATPFPMALLPDQIGPHVTDNFYMLNANTAYLGREGCKSDTVTGCRLSLAERPIACGLFPIVLANGRLYLYLNCPAVLFTPLAHFLDLALEAAKFLETFSLPDLEHISLALTDKVLASDYIDMRITIFDKHGKKTVLD